MNDGSMSFQGSRPDGRREISMLMHRSNLRFLTLFGMTVIGFFLSTCSSSIPESRTASPPTKKTAPSVPTPNQFLPDGWADITTQSKQPQVKLWLVNRDYSATMVLRELQTTSKTLVDEEMNLVATISLHSKITDNDTDHRVTRVPAIIDMKRNFSSYAYLDKGLLRRVVVFKKQGRLMELELMQEHSSAEFDTLTNDLVTFATTLYER